MNLKFAATVCPLRERNDGLEVLMVKRAMIKPDGKLMSYHGEWVFAGGGSEVSDLSLEETGMREFREETFYDGEIRIYLLDALTFQRNGTIHNVNFYIARIDSDYVFSLPANGEVVAVKWNSPVAWLAYLMSEEFTRQQMEAFRTHGIACEREQPYQTYKTLGRIASEGKSLLRLLD